MKICTKCGVEKDESEFYKNFNMCKKCDNERKKIRKSENKLIGLKLNGFKCRLCNKEYKTENDIIFQFHHIDPKSKESEFNDIHSTKKYLKEIGKCILVCANCHTEIHSGFYPEYLTNKSVIDASDKVCESTKLRRKRKLQAIEYMGGKCSKCGYNKCPSALCFHHKNQLDKEIDIGTYSGIIPWNILKVELDKCDMLCKNCHFELHAHENTSKNINNERKCFICGGINKTKRYFCDNCKPSIKSKNYKHIIDKPNKEQLEKELSEMSQSEVAKKHNVCWNAVKKWKIKYGIQKSSEN